MPPKEKVAVAVTMTVDKPFPPANDFQRWLVQVFANNDPDKIELRLLIGANAQKLGAPLDTFVVQKSGWKPTAAQIVEMTDTWARMAQAHCSDILKKPANYAAVSYINKEPKPASSYPMALTPVGALVPEEATVLQQVKAVLEDERFDASEVMAANVDLTKRQAVTIDKLVEYNGKLISQNEKLAELNDKLREKLTAVQTQEGDSCSQTKK